MKKIIGFAIALAFAAPLAATAATPSPGRQAQSYHVQAPPSQTSPQASQPDADQTSGPGF